MPKCLRQKPLKFWENYKNSYDALSTEMSVNTVSVGKYPGRLVLLLLEILSEAGREFGQSHHPAHQTNTLWSRSSAVDGVVLWSEVLLTGLKDHVLPSVPTLVLKVFKTWFLYFFCSPQKKIKYMNTSNRTAWSSSKSLISLIYSWFGALH